MPILVQLPGESFYCKGKKQVVTNVPHIRSQPPWQEEYRSEYDAEDGRIEEIDGVGLRIFQVVRAQSFPKHTGRVLIVEVIGVSSSKYFERCCEECYQQS